MRKLLRTIVTIVIVVLVIIAIGILTSPDRRGGEETGGGADSGQPSTEAAAPPDWCPAFEFIAVPGTWETDSADDPFHPQHDPSLLKSVTEPLQSMYDINYVRVFTIPYTAQFRHIGALNEMSYDDSRQDGTNRLKGEMQYVADLCPQTKFILSGFSQGAVIAGDVASDIGQGRGPVTADRVAGVALIADGRREPGVGIDAGRPVDGVGAEIALQDLSGAIQAIVPGATMRGPRLGGFGELNDRVFEVCGEGDLVCDSSPNLQDPVGTVQGLISGNAVHMQYATNTSIFPEQTPNSWVVGWATVIIDSANPGGVAHGV